MSQTVSDLVGRARRAEKGTSSLDAIMGEDWAHYKAGNPRKARQVEFLLKQHRSRSSAAGGLIFRVGQRKQQAVVKMIRQGGASNALGLRAQMTYLRKDESVDLRRSEGFFGVEIDEAEQLRMEKAWGMKEGQGGGADRTSHFVVSFPIGTDRDAAARIGRAWAEEMFESGRLGDRYDYYTAEHRDTAHPHMHVVAYRRGLDNGDWLKVSRRSELNYDFMRELQAELSLREGIELEATPRLSRGLYERPMPDARVRQGLEGREVEPPSHSEVSAIATAAAAVSLHNQMRAEARFMHRSIEPVEPEIDELIESLRAGELLDALPATSAETRRELRDLSISYGSRREEVIGDFAKLRLGAAELSTRQERIDADRQLADLHREASAMFPDDKALQAFVQHAEASDYRGIQSSYRSALADKLRGRAEQRAASMAQEAGLNSDLLFERFEEHSVSDALAAYWRGLEIEERRQWQREQGLPVDTPARAREALKTLHNDINETFEAADRSLQRFEPERTRDRDLTARQLDQDRSRDRGLDIDDDWGL